MFQDRGPRGGLPHVRPGPQKSRSWEDVDREYNGAWTNILDPTFAAYVKQQLEFASNLVTATGANMVFMTGACTSEGLQANGQPWPEDDPARRAVYNGLVRQVAAEYPTTDSVDDLDAVVCPGGGGEVQRHLQGRDHPRRRRGPFPQVVRAHPGRGEHASDRGRRSGPAGQGGCGRVQAQGQDEGEVQGQLETPVPTPWPQARPQALAGPEAVGTGDRTDDVTRTDELARPRDAPARGWDRGSVTSISSSIGERSMRIQWLSSDKPCPRTMIRSIC